MVTCHYFCREIKVYKDTVFDAKVIKVIGVGVAYYLGSPRPILRLSLLCICIELKQQVELLRSYNKRLPSYSKLVFRLTDIIMQEVKLSILGWGNQSGACMSGTITQSRQYILS